jgi:cytochrome c553
MKRTILVLFTLGLAACAPASHEDVAGFIIAGDFQTLTYQNVNANAIQPACIRCHSGDDAAADVNLETYASVFKNRKEIAEQVESGKMPRKSTMDPQAKDLLLKWIAAGAPET